MTQKKRKFPQIVSLILAIGQDYGEKSSECRNISIKAEKKRGKMSSELKFLPITGFGLQLLKASPVKP